MLSSHALLEDDRVVSRVRDTTKIVFQCLGVGTRPKDWGGGKFRHAI